MLQEVLANLKEKQSATAFQAMGKRVNTVEKSKYSGQISRFQLISDKQNLQHTLFKDLPMSQMAIKKAFRHIPCYPKIQFEVLKSKRVWGKNPDYAEHFEGLELGGFTVDASDTPHICHQSHEQHYPPPHPNPQKRRRKKWTFILI